MTNKELNHWFQHYNKKYFRGKLPKCQVRFRKVEDNDLGQCEMDIKIPLIDINPALGKWRVIVKTTLLHEMVHISLSSRVEHGPRFQREMLRLAKAGAFKGLW